MGKLIVTVAIALVIYLVVAKQQEKPKVELADASIILGECKAKKTCITAYVAPWCGVCKASIPSFRLLNAFINEHRPDVGFNIVVGAGRNPNDNTNEASNLSPLKAVADDSGELMQASRIAAFPTWIVREQSGREIYRQAGGLQIAKAEQAELLLRELLSRQ